MDTSHGCHEDPEYHRPKRYLEVLNGEDTWHQYGIRIVGTDPEIPSSGFAEVGHPLNLRVFVEVRRDPQKAPQCVFATCWTHIKTKVGRIMKGDLSIGGIQDTRLHLKLLP